MSKKDQSTLQVIRDRGEMGSSALASALGISRQAAHQRLRTLVEKGELRRVGASRSTRYRLADHGPWRFCFSCSGLEEHVAWDRLREGVGALAALEEPALGLYHYAFTELVNNAIDHAESNEVCIEVIRSGATLALEIVDEGVGVFARVQRGLALSSRIEALWEISKGKTTTDRERHTGEGLFFVSKGADVFRLESDELAWVVDNLRGDQSIEEVRPARKGTLARFEARPEAARELKALFDAYTDDFEFSRTRVVVKLFEYGERFVSRSEAKRLMQNLERFRDVVMDFTGVKGVGQGFADEVFRVWARAHPETALEAISMNDPVAFMVERARNRGS